MAKWVCNVCGYVYEGDAAPEVCPQCKAPASKFTEQKGEMTWAAEHVVGVAQGVSEDILEDLRANFQGECSEVGMYLAMSRVAHREGYPEIGLYWEKAALEHKLLLGGLADGAEVGSGISLMDVTTDRANPLFHDVIPPAYFNNDILLLCGRSSNQ